MCAEVRRHLGHDVHAAHALASHGIRPAEHRRHGVDHRVHGVVGQRDDDRDRRRVLGQSDQLLIVDDERAFLRRLLQPVRLRDGKVRRQLDGDVRLQRHVVLEQRAHALARIGVARADGLQRERIIGAIDDGDADVDRRAGSDRGVGGGDVDGDAGAGADGLEQLAAFHREPRIRLR